ncbi:acetyltransferase (GNAT) family protein [Kutzneria buriramensis]|uniref:Acetyltransferase (GNAT) family protein n=2 Tax=Kutzneria buriramensis TaxID=1045776 RepID=A0A3E0I0R6_9PSEU|nr:acetyltransferase (GNAT) family protein [Kutzneria buriramensis]
MGHAPVMTWTVRRAGPGDVGELARINCESWQHSARGVVPDVLLDRMLPESYLNGWRRWVRLPDPDGVFVAEDEAGRLGSYCTVAEARDDDDIHADLRTGELIGVHADPLHMGTGAGRAVHDAALDHLAEQGFRYAVLWVLKDDWTTRSFYAHHGWRHDGATKDHAAGDQRVPVVRYGRFLNARKRNRPPSGFRFPAFG